jgi:hypothetical protein
MQQLLLSWPVFVLFEKACTADKERNACLRVMSHALRTIISTIAGKREYVKLHEMDGVDNEADASPDMSLLLLPLVDCTNNVDRLKKMELGQCTFMKE